MKNVMTDGIWGWAYSLGTFRKKIMALSPRCFVCDFQKHGKSGFLEVQMNEFGTVTPQKGWFQTTPKPRHLWVRNGTLIFTRFSSFSPWKCSTWSQHCRDHFQKPPPKKADQSHNFSMVAWIPVPLSSTSFSTWFNGNFRIL